MHTSTDDHDSALHTSHLHGFDSDNHDHEGDVDISLFEENNNWFKQIQFFLVFAILLIAIINIAPVVRPPPLDRTSHYKQSYLRPILRAPPISR